MLNNILAMCCSLRFRATANKRSIQTLLVPEKLYNIIFQRLENGQMGCPPWSTAGER